MTLTKGGTASDVGTYQFLPPTDDWGFPKYPHRTAILPPDVDLAAEIKNFILTNETYLQEPDCWLGTWINPHTQHYYLDVATCRKTLDEARQAAIEASYRTGRKIVALYNSKRNRTVFLWDDVQA